MKSQIPIFIFSLALAGCTTAHTTDRPVPLLGEKPNFESLHSFQRLVKATPGTDDYERVRIDYLLERIGASPYHFIRNDTEYSNARSVMHLRWKYLRYKKDAPTAEAFINRIATGSKKTGQEYLIRKSPTEVYPLNQILRQELNLLSEGFREYQARTKDQSRQSRHLGTDQTAGNEFTATFEDPTVKKSSQSAEVISHNKQPI